MLPYIASYLLIGAALCSGQLINKNVTRVIDISTTIVKIKTEILIENRQFNKVKTYTYTVDPGVNEFYGEFLNRNHELLQHIKNYDTAKDLYVITVYLDKSIRFEETYKVFANFYYLHQIKPAYKKLKLDHPHYLKYIGNSHFFSPYETLFCQSLYLKSSKFRRSIASPGDKEFYNYLNDPPHAFELIEIVYENNDRHLLVKNLDREIAISHLGQITVQDVVMVENIGSSIVGSFEPNLYELHHSEQNWFYTHLPPSATAIHLFDTLGYIFGYQVLSHSFEKSIKFQLRYPVLRGWKASYTLQYSIPVFEYIQSNNENRYQLDVRAVDHVLNDVTIENARVKILLPEGAEVKSVSLLSGFNRLNDTLEFTALTYYGRPTILLEGKNLLELHIAPITITYDFPRLFLLRVPILVAAYIEAVFLTVIIIRRCNFGLK